MNNLRLFTLTIAICSIYVLSSCDNSSGEGPSIKTDILIVNEGNFGAGNGSISSYDEEEQTITNNFVKSANGGSEIGALVQSIHVQDGIGYIICNSDDKIEFINAENGQYLANPLTDISQPRYMTVVGDKGYVSCWGPWDTSDPNWWKLSDSYIAVVDLGTRTVVDSLICGSGPEGIVAVGDQLFVANSFYNSVSVVNLNDNTTREVSLTASPIHLIADLSAQVWVSTSSGLQSINSNTLDIESYTEVENIQGKIAFDGSNGIYVLTVEPWEPGKLNFASEVYMFDIVNEELSSAPVITGDDFYGIGFNESTDHIYVTDSKAFSGPGEVLVYETNGTLVDMQTTAVGPNGLAIR